MAKEINVTDVAEQDVFQLRIKKILKNAGKSQKWLADELGISAANLSASLNGLNGFSIPRLVEIAKVLRVEFCDLFERTGWCDDVDPGDMFDRVVIVHSNDVDDVCITDGDIKKVSKSIGKSYNEVGMMLCGSVAVTPHEYSVIASILDDRAYKIMPNIRVEYDFDVVDEYE